jgi:hypothetical protein
MTVRYIAIITCSCSTTVEADAYAYDRAVMEHDAPNGWLGGYDDSHPYRCPECVAKWAATDSIDIEELYKK